MTPRKRAAKKRDRNTVRGLALAQSALDVQHPDAHKHRALKAFLRHGTVSAGCNGAKPKVSRTTFYKWASEDALFGELFVAAQQDVTDRIEQASIKRSIAGSDTLAIFLLKKRRPEIYADRVTITELSPELQLKIQQMLQLIGSKATWDSEELINALESQVWSK